MCFLFPIHLGLHRLYHLFTTMIHEGGARMHACAHEQDPAGLRCCWAACAPAVLSSTRKGVAPTHTHMLAAVPSVSSLTVSHCFACAGGHAGYEMAPFIPTLEGLVALLVQGPRKHTRGLNTVR